MKTKEQTKQEITNYLTKCSNHTFAKVNGDLFKIYKFDNKFYSIYYRQQQAKISEIDIDLHLSIYSPNNAKCVLKHNLFLNKNLKAIRNTKNIKEMFESVIPFENKVRVEP